jgi:hypothetical protein
MIRTAAWALAFALPLACGFGPTSDNSECARLPREYKAALPKTRECTVGAVHQCEQPAVEDLYCQCNTAVNGPTVEIQALRNRFRELGCPRFCSDGGLCSPTAQTCRADPSSSTGGLCVPTMPRT